jgi:hypothetical protein
VAPRELGDTTSQMPGIEPTDPGFAKLTDGPTQIRWPVAPKKRENYGVPIVGSRSPRMLES